MLPSPHTGHLSTRVRILLFEIAVACFLCLIALVGFPNAEVMASDEGCGCHSVESTSWANSMHAQAFRAQDIQGPTCEDCHGTYKRGHPDEGTMALTTDSRICADCHAETYDQWLSSTHAQENVQCIGCHLTHSQTLRLSVDELCASCHRDSPADEYHDAHHDAHIGCTTCHVAESAAQDATTVQTIALRNGHHPVPRHDFIAVDSAGCIDCHTKQIRGDPAFEGTNSRVTELLQIANRVPTLSARLDAAEQTNNRLASMAYTALGLGTGVGALIGMVVVMAVGFVSKKEE